MGNSTIPEREQPDIERSEDQQPLSPDQEESPTPDNEAAPIGPPPGWLYSPVDNQYRPISDMFGLLG
jgi:hypothetical protein